MLPSPPKLIPPHLRQAWVVSRLEAFWHKNCDTKRNSSLKSVKRLLPVSASAYLCCGINWVNY